MQNNTAHILVLPNLQEIQLIDCLTMVFKALEEPFIEVQRAEVKELLVRMDDWFTKKNKFFQHEMNHDYRPTFLGLIESGLNILNESENFLEDKLSQDIMNLFMNGLTRNG